MSDTQLIPSAAERPRRLASKMSVVSIWLKRILDRAEFGSLTVVLPNGRCIETKTAQPGPEAALVLRRWRALWRLQAAGDIGFARAYIDGDWWTPDLLGVLEFGTRNADALSTTLSGSTLSRLLNRARHWQSRNTRRGSRRNIAAHYDLGNSFYSPWLDRGMNYSSALYSGHARTQTLEEAQEAKLDQVVELLDLSGGERILEIGCGWGSLVERLTPHCQVTGVTLSAEQLAYAKQRISFGEHEHRADLRLQDYRDITGQYDRLVSIEMIEAVGEIYWPVYFGKVRDLLTNEGAAVIQAITIAEARYSSYRDRPDFIQQYIFPGGMLPTFGVMQAEAARAGLRLDNHQSFGPSYARTLSAWRERFLAAWPRLQTLGFDSSFKRMWEYYLTYCEAGFLCGDLQVGLFKFRADGSRRSGTSA